MKQASAHPAIILSPAQTAFIQGNVSIAAASSGSAAATHLAKVFGCRVAADGSTITIIVGALQAGALLADVRVNRKLAIVFCRPTTVQTLQIKTLDAQVVALERDDYQTIASHADKMVAEVALLGFPEAIARPLFSCSNSDAVALRFTPTAVFDQTPGPNAGALLQGAG